MKKAAVDIGDEDRPDGERPSAQAPAAATTRADASEAKLPSRIDAFVGRRVRERRKALKLTQEALADRLGVTFQQVQKYERGANRVSAGRLFELAAALGIGTAYFFEGLETAPAAEPVGTDPDLVDLVAAFLAIRDPERKRRVLAAAKTAAREEGWGPPDGRSPAALQAMMAGAGREKT